MEEIKYSKIREKHPEELSLQEMIFIHLNLSIEGIVIKNRKVRSTLSFMIENINHGFAQEKSKSLMPLLACLSVLDHLGGCYSRSDMDNPKKVRNNIKKALYYFGELEETDPIIKTLYGLRNGLLHNVSLASVDEINNENHYHFRYDSEITDVFKSAELKWDGKFETLDGSDGQYTTAISPERIRQLVLDCIKRARQLNLESKLKLELKQGVMELFFSCIR